MKNVALKLKDEGILCKKKPFSSITISYMLKNPVYYGHYVVNRYKYEYNPKTGKYRRTKELKPESAWVNYEIPAIISKQQWDRIQNRTKRNKIKSKRAAYSSESYWLKNVLLCGVCGGKISHHHGTKRKDGTYPRYYSCYWSTASPQILELSGKEKKCSLPTIKARQIENRIWLSIIYFLGYTETKDEIILPLIESYDDKFKDLKAQLFRHKETLKKCDIERKRIKEVLNDERFDKDEFASMLNDNKRERLEIESEHEEVKEKINQIKELKSNQKKWREFEEGEYKKRLANAINVLDPVKKRLLTEGMVDRRDIHQIISFYLADSERPISAAIRPPRCALMLVNLIINLYFYGRLSLQIFNKISRY